MLKRSVLYLLPTTAIDQISAAGERLGVPDSGIVTALAGRASELTQRDVEGLKGRGRKGGGRRGKKKPTNGE